VNALDRGESRAAATSPDLQSERAVCCWRRLHSMEVTRCPGEMERDRRVRDLVPGEVLDAAWGVAACEGSRRARGRVASVSALPVGRRLRTGWGFPAMG